MTNIDPFDAYMTAQKRISETIARDGGAPHEAWIALEHAYMRYLASYSPDAIRAWLPERRAGQ